RRPSIRRHPLAAIEASIFLCRPFALIAPFLKVCLGGFDRKTRQVGLERGARLVEGRRGAAAALARLAARIEPTSPLPFGRGAGIADTLRDHADADVAIEHAPAFLREVTIAAASEVGLPYDHADQAGREAASDRVARLAGARSCLRCRGRAARNNAQG